MGKPGDGTMRGTCEENEVCSTAGCIPLCLVQNLPAKVDCDAKGKCADGARRGNCKEDQYCFKDGYCKHWNSTAWVKA